MAPWGVDCRLRAYALRAIGVDNDANFLSNLEEIFSGLLDNGFDGAVFVFDRDFDGALFGGSAFNL